MKLESVKADSSRYLSLLARMFFASNAVWLALPLLAGAGLSLLDVRWLIVSLMLVFIAVPMLLALCYIYYGLSEEARWSVMEKDITIGPDGLLLEFAHPRMSNRLIGWNQVTRIVLNDGDVLLMLAVRRYTFLLIPSSSISDPGARCMRPCRLGCASMNFCACFSLLMVEMMRKYLPLLAPTRSMSVATSASGCASTFLAAR